MIGKTVVISEEFCKGNDCDQLIPSMGGSFAKCKMVHRELFRVFDCPRQYDRFRSDTKK